MNEVNFIDRRISDKDIESFGFGDSMADGTAIIIEDNWLLAHVMHAARIFPSVSEARKNGWNKPIPKGMSEFIVGKRKTRVWILGELDNG